MEFKFSSFELKTLVAKIDSIIAEFDIEKVKNKFDEPDEKQSHLYSYLMDLQDVKSNVDFLYSHMKLSNIKRIEIESTDYYEEDFEDILFDLRIFIMQIEYEISNPKMDNINPYKILKQNNYRTHTPEERTQKQTLHLVLKKAENYLFPKNDLAISRAVHELTKFSRKTVMGDINEGKKFKIKIYENAITQLNIIIQDIQKEQEKLYPKY